MASPATATTSIGPDLDAAVAVGEPERRLEQHVARDHEGEDRVQQRRQDLEPEQPERARRRRCEARLATTIDPRARRDGHRVGEHVGGVRQQRQRAGHERR